MGRVQFPTKQPMPGNVRTALEKRKLMDAYMERPAYQKDEYLKWIALAAGPLEKQKRLDQMLDELEKGGLFKGEPYTSPEKPAAAAPSKPGNPTGAGKATTAGKASAPRKASTPGKASKPGKPGSK